MRKLVFIVFLFVNLISKVSGQTKLNLYFVHDSDMTGQLAFIKNNNIKTYEIIYQSFFVTNEKFDENKLKKQLLAKFPNQNDGGLCILDWEGQALKTFQNQNNKIKFEYYKGEFKKAIVFAQKFRPNVKFAFFHLLYLNYGGTVASFRKQNSNLDDLVRLQNFIAPSLYIYNPQTRLKQRNDNYMRNKLLQALEAGAKFNLPVYPLVWHRTPSQVKGGGYELVSFDDFKNVFNLISSTNYKGGYARGLLWWHSESFSYRNRSKYSSSKNEYRSISDVNDYQSKMFQNYFNVIKSYVK